MADRFSTSPAGERDDRNRSGGGPSRSGDPIPGSRRPVWKYGDVAVTDALSVDSGRDGPGRSATVAATPSIVRWAYRVGLILFCLQFCFLLGLSVFTYRRFTLGIDFAIFSQAWTQIGTGHLDPMSTIHGVRFVDNHFELIMWPLALVHLVLHSPFVLLVVQDVALVGMEVVAFTWVAAMVRRSDLPTTWIVAILAGTGALLLAAPGTYSTVVEDFHFEALAMFFIVFAAYDFWSGRTRRMWAWVVLCLLCGDVGGLYVLGIGLSGMLFRGTRRDGLALFALGMVWVGLISVIGANQGSNLSSGYAYLAGRSAIPGGFSGLWLVGSGVVTHPGRAWHIATPRAGTAARYVLNGGGFGLFTPWGFAVPLVVLGTSMLQYDGIFIGLPFQNVVVIPFVAFGSAWLVVWLAVRARTTAVTALAIAVGVASVLIGLATSAQRLQTALQVNASHGFVSGPDAAALSRTLARTPADAEVAAPLPTVGRFGQRPFVYLLVDQPGTAARPVPISAPTVVVVVDPAITPELFPPHKVTVLVHRLEAEGARALVSSAGVTALIWHPSPGLTSIRMP